MQKRRFTAERLPLILGTTWLLAGILLRIAIWLQNRSLFLDEANLARNLIEKNFFDLLAPLAYQQYAPPLFLWVEKSILLLFGNGEMSLRLFPLGCGVTALVLLCQTGRAFWTSSWVVMVPLWLMAFSPDFLRYATEIKQYSTDIVVTLGLLLLAYRYPPDSASRAPLIWGTAGIISIWFSMPSVFMLSGMAAFALYQSDSRKAWATWIAVLFGWMVSFGIYYFFILRQDVGREELQAYHRDYFFPLLPLTLEEWSRVFAIFRSIFRTAFGYTAAALSAGLVFFLLGLWRLFRKQFALLLLLAVPLLSCWLASALHQYSLMPRLTLFFIPLMWLISGFGLEWLWNRPQGWWTKVIALAGLAVMLPLQDGYRYFLQPYEIEELKPVLEQLEAILEDREAIYVHHEAVPAFLYYSRYHPQRKTPVFNYAYLADWSDRPAEWFQQQAGQNCCWLVYSHLISGESRRELEAQLSELNDLAGLQKELTATGARACYVCRDAK